MYFLRYKNTTIMLYNMYSYDSLIVKINILYVFFSYHKIIHVRNIYFKKISTMYIHMDSDALLECYAKRI